MDRYRDMAGVKDEYFLTRVQNAYKKHTVFTSLLQFKKAKATYKSQIRKMLKSSSKSKSKTEFKSKSKIRMKNKNKINPKIINSNIIENQSDT